jgi:superfamily II DNA or RNA helicase
MFGARTLGFDEPKKKICQHTADITQRDATMASIAPAQPGATTTGDDDEIPTAPMYSEEQATSTASYSTRNMHNNEGLFRDELLPPVVPCYGEADTTTVTSNDGNALLAQAEDPQVIATTTEYAANVSIRTRHLATSKSPLEDVNNVNVGKKNTSLTPPPSGQKRKHSVIETATSTTTVAAASKIRPALSTQLFPPCLFTDAIYSKGIRTADPSKVPSNYIVTHPKQLQKLAPVQYLARYPYKQEHKHQQRESPRRQPFLTATENKLWFHQAAAKYAAQKHFPMQVGRLMGIITRTLTEHCPESQPLLTAAVAATRKTTKGTLPAWPTSTAKDKAGEAVKKTKAPPALSKTQAMKEAKADATRSGVELNAGQLEVQAAQNKVDWANVLTPGTAATLWDAKGELRRAAVQDTDYITCSTVLERLQSEELVDEYAGQHQSLYNGLRNIPVDTATVLASLLELATPEELYETPLITPYTVVQLEATHQDTVDGNDATSKSGQRLVTRTYQLQIGVYCNRLLFEVMTARDLHIVVSALDQGSYRVTQPLHLPPTPHEVTFCSSPYPTVVFDDDEEDEGSNDDDSVVDLAKDDVRMMNSTRADSTVSAFTARGLLKLLESQGNDISNWSTISKSIEPVLKVKLMLHQIHGVCWMLQMEHLGGFGLNSLFWEEREFADGGKWFYSPATGQARLSLGGTQGRPPVMKGGILVDEMGLGKTIVVLALVVATLAELKTEAARRVDGGMYKHATLIVVPPAILGQWLSEIRKVTGDALVYEVFDYNTLSFERKSTKEGPADIVVTTYAALESNNRKNNAAKILKACSWGRVVLDEMQEIRSSTTAIAKNCEELECERRWMLSGTPLFDGVEDFRGELCFLRLEPFAGNLDDGFFDFAVKSHWNERSRHGLDTLRVLSLLMLRRSKSMTIRTSNLPLLGLKPLNLIFEPVPQDRSERALYCFMEYLVHATISQGGEADKTKNKTFLRFLRELCVSPALLNGGLSCSSQLPILNRLMIDHNHREYSGTAPEIAANTLEESMSCDEAIRFLSQVQDVARVDEDFATSLTVGGGGGISRRNRATDSIEQQHKEAQSKVLRATQHCEAARSKRAKARWHMALERITTGELSFKIAATISPSIARLWRWRFVLTKVVNDSSATLPEMLTRGWRPSEAFFATPSSKRAKANWQLALDKITRGDIYVPVTEAMSKATKSILRSWKWRFLMRNVSKRGKSGIGQFQATRKIPRDLSLTWLHSKRPDFDWAHPFSLLLEAIPSAMTSKHLHESILRLLAINDSEAEFIVIQSKERTRVLGIRGPSDSTSWKAIVQFANHHDCEKVYKKSQTTDGLRLDCPEQFQWIEVEIASTKAKFDEAAAENKVYPCDINKWNESAAKKAYRTAQLGLRLNTKDKCRPGHVTVDRAIGSLRGVKPKSCATLHDTLNWSVEDESGRFAVNQGIKVHQEQLAKRLESMLSNSEVSQEIQSLSAFDALQELRKGEAEKTRCPICLGFLGGAPDGGGLVSLTRCGHLFCRGCLGDYQQTKTGEGRYDPPCPSCRKTVHFGQVIQVDPTRTADQEAFEKRRADAKSLVQQASTMLESSNGQLDPYLWEALYLAMDLPHGANTSVHGTFTAIPGQVLAHLRHATGMPLHCGAHETLDTAQLSSKMRALLEDLPSDERSVVFASSKQTVKHLMTVLEDKRIGCRGLYTGQSEEKSEHAVEEWKSSKTTRVLVVQAGAAACGLTLTAASKMFILEPFIKHEEEQQAYARLHRYGQQKEVVCKIYYTPVSVESRLLEWRKRATGATEEMIVYAPVRTEELEEETEVVEKNQTRFLLGLKDGNESFNEDIDCDSLDSA